MTDQPVQEVPPEHSLRLFTAVAFPPEVVARIDDLLARLQKGVSFTGAHPTWVKAENVHLTLIFLGQQDRERVTQVRSAMDDIAAHSAAPLRLKLSGLHLFPTPKEPRVISLGLSGDVEELTLVRENLAKELRRRGFAVESRPFRPHVTLARIKSMRGVPGLRDVMAAHQRIEPGRFEADRITLFNSTLTPAGSVYEVVHETRLAGEPQSDSSP